MVDVDEIYFLEKIRLEEDGYHPIESERKMVENLERKGLVYCHLYCYHPYFAEFNLTFSGENCIQQNNLNRIEERLTA